VRCVPRLSFQASAVPPWSRPTMSSELAGDRWSLAPPGFGPAEDRHSFHSSAMWSRWSGGGVKTSASELRCLVHLHVHNKAAHPFGQGILMPKLFPAPMKS